MVWKKKVHSPYKTYPIEYLPSQRVVSNILISKKETYLFGGKYKSFEISPQATTLRETLFVIKLLWWKTFSLPLTLFAFQVFNICYLEQLFGIAIT